MRGGIVSGNGRSTRSRCCMCPFTMRSVRVRTKSVWPKRFGEWVAARPAQLINTPARKQYRAEARLGPGGATKIARADVAHFMIRAAQETSWLGQAVGLAY